MDTVGLVANVGDEGKRLVQPAGLIKNPGMSDHAQETAQHQVTHAIRLLTVDHRLQPRSIGCMIGGILSVCIHQNIDVRQNHGALP
jgi:hypothetical protein